MLDIETENRAIPGRIALSWDLIHHIFHHRLDEAVVITEKPVALMSASRKQWFKLLRQVQKERASTLDVQRIQELDKTVLFLNSRVFTLKQSQAASQKSIFYRSFEEFVLSPLKCDILYVTHSINTQELEKLTKSISQRGRMILYDRPKSKMQYGDGG
jgi:uracil DNA glycosylase